MKIKELYKKYEQPIWFVLILIFSAFLRIYLFPYHPAGLNQDEASIGYDAWALLNYGVDRNGYTMPVHLRAWGSGQNALYAYLSMPFIKLFGLNVFSVRCVNLIFGILSIVAVFFIVKKIWGVKPAFIAMALTGIAPWHIMLSRWALESNLFPAMFILALWALIKAFDSKWFLCLSAILFGLSLYSYGSAYLVIPLFCFICFVYIIIKKLIPLKICIISAILFFVVAAPIFTFVIVNLKNLGDMRLGILSIPQMYGSRMKQLIDFSLITGIKNFVNNVILQTDFYIHNALPYYGCIYIISFPFYIIGIFRAFKEKGKYNFIILTALFCSLALFFAYANSNINRVNIVYLPLILLTAYGLSEIIKNKTMVLAVICTYLIFFSGFSYQYFGKDYKEEIGSAFFDSLGSAITKANELADENDTIYVTQSVNMPYIYVLFYSQISPKEFQETVQYEEDYVEFQQVVSFGKYVFDNNVYRRNPGIYIINNYEDYFIHYHTDEIL